MEENNINENTINENNHPNAQAGAAQRDEKHICSCRSSWKEYLCVIAAAAAGGFLALYFIADQALYRHYKHSGLMKAPLFFERMYDDDFKEFERSFDRLDNFERGFGRHFNRHFNKHFDKHFDKRGSNNPFMFPENSMDAVEVNTEIDSDKYKVIIGLNSFQGDERRINYNVSGRKLTVFGSSKVKDKKYEQNISFSQDFLLPDNAVISKIKKEKDGNKLVISIPLKK